MFSWLFLKIILTPVSRWSNLKSFIFSVSMQRSQCCSPTDNCVSFPSRILVVPSRRFCPFGKEFENLKYIIRLEMSGRLSFANFTARGHRTFKMKQCDIGNGTEIWINNEIQRKVGEDPNFRSVRWWPKNAKAFIVL